MCAIQPVIKLNPSIVERPWGFEEWSVSADEENPSYVNLGGDVIGLNAFLNAWGPQIMGPRWVSDCYFPILGKTLVCKEKLSVQVHPIKDVARKYGCTAKEEFWFITNCKEDAHVLAGFECGVTEESFTKHLNRNCPEKQLKKLDSYKGACLFIPWGCPHAISGGNIIFEMQSRASDNDTHRLWDYNRLGLDGKPRELHIEQAMASMAFDDCGHAFMDSAIVGDGTTLVSCESFRITQFIKSNMYQEFTIAATNQPRIIYVVSGSGRTNDPYGIPLSTADVGIVPCNMDLHITAGKKGIHVLVTDQFFLN